MTDVQTSPRTRAKLDVLNAAMATMYGQAWIGRWSKSLFEEHWGPIVENVDSEQLVRTIRNMISTRTSDKPPLPAQFRDMLKPLAPDDPPTPTPSYPPRSSENILRLAKLYRSLGLPPPFEVTAPVSA